MVERLEVPKGIWYEEARSRWRVKLFCDGELFHRSYHHSFNDALLAWKGAKRKMIRPSPVIPIQEASLINRFLCQPLVGASRVQGH